MISDDEHAWREFNVRYSRLIYRCITRVTARFSAVVGPEDVREIYAMLCVGLLANDKRKLRSFEPGRGNKLGSWIGMLAIHTAYDYLRGVKREPKRGCMAEAEDLTSDVPDPCEAYAMRERAQYRRRPAAGLQRQGPRVHRALLRRGARAGADRAPHGHQREDRLLEKAQDPHPARGPARGAQAGGVARIAVPAPLELATMVDEPRASPGVHGRHVADRFRRLSGAGIEGAPLSVRLHG